MAARKYFLSEEPRMQSLYLSDITLKLAQAPSDGYALSFREKIEAAKLLDRLNVSAIELAPIENVKIDSLLVKSIASAVRRSLSLIHI